MEIRIIRRIPGWLTGVRRILIVGGELKFAHRTKKGALRIGLKPRCGG